MTVYVVMGISGCGKSTVGSAASRELGLQFFDADDLHSPRAIAKMQSGVALNELEREPWADTIIKCVNSARARNPKTPVLLACSALRKAFRNKLRNGFNGNIVFLHLTGDVWILKRRLSARKGHFFKAGMLASQFAALEMPRRAITLDIALPVEQQVDIIRSLIETQSSGVLG